MSWSQAGGGGHADGDKVRDRYQVNRHAEPVSVLADLLDFSTQVADAAA